MKKVFLFSLAALALVACAKDAAVKVSDSNGIKFNTVVDYSSRAEATKSNTLNSFNAWAFYGTNETKFADKVVSKSGSDWSIAGGPYDWPGKNTEVTFYAINPAASELSPAIVQVTKAAQKIVDYAPAVKAEEQKDIIFSTATGTEAANGSTGVTLNFKHLLSQITVNAKIKENSGYKIKVLSAKIERAVKKGSFAKPTSYPTLVVTDWGVRPADKNTGRFVAIQEASSGKFVTLDEQINKSCMVERGNFFTIPQDIKEWNGEATRTDITPNTTDNDGLWLGLAVIIVDKNDNQIYPVLRTRGSSQNSGKYGYIAFPMKAPKTGKFEAGKIYTYNIVLGGTTLGQVPPTTPGLEDPSKPSNPDIDTTPGKDDDGRDRYKPGDPIKGAEIKFTTVTVEEYTEGEVITIGA